MNFHGIGRLYGMQAIPVLQNARMMVVGIGGVGSWAAESLARTGVGNIMLVDLDDICTSNINRQVHALTSTVGQLKVDVQARRLMDINPELRVDVVASFLSKKNLGQLLEWNPNVIIDCTDDVDNKCLLAITAREQSLTLVMVGASGGRREPAMISATDLSVSSNDKLLYRIRKQLRQDHGFPLDHQGEFGIRCISSQERAVYPTEDGCLSREPSKADQRMDCASGFGSSTFVTGTFGFHAAAEAVKLQLAKNNIPWV